jgi:hypothetical protein
MAGTETATRTLGIGNADSNTIPNIAIRLRWPTLQDFIVAAQRVGAKLDAATQSFINQYEKLGFIEKAILSQIPFAGDTIDLAIQGYKKAKGQNVDPVVVVLSAIGLAADGATVGTVGLAGGLNASVAVLKATYQTLSPAAKTALKAIFEAASNSPKAMKALQDALPELASLAQSGKLAQLLQDPKYVKFVISKLIKGSSGIGESIFRSKEGEKSDSDYQVTTQEGSGLASQEAAQNTAKAQYDAIVKKLKETGIPVTVENIKEVLTALDSPEQVVENVLNVAREAQNAVNQAIP